MPTDGSGVWAYAVIEGVSCGDRIAGLIGVAGEQVRVVAGDELSAAVGTVPLAEFGEEALRRHLEDLDWLAVAARAHDSVISALARSGPVLPVRMATVYLDDESVKKLLETRRHDFLAALDRVRGRDELGVKAYVHPEQLVSQSDSVRPESGGRPSGTAYLMRRRRALASQEEAYRVAAAEADRLHAALLRQAVDGKRKPASDPKLSARRAWTVLNGTYLVERDKVDAFRAAVTALEETAEGIELEITGPWPPYSFAGDVVNP